MRNRKLAQTKKTMKEMAIDIYLDGRKAGVELSRMDYHS